MWNHVSRMFKVFLIMRLMAQQVNAVETVNVVDFCGQTVQGVRVTVNSHQESRKHYFVTMGTDCHLTMQAASAGDKVQFRFHSFLVYSLLRVSPLGQHHISSTTLQPQASKRTPLPGPARQKPSAEAVLREGGADPCHAGSYIQFYDGKGKGHPTIGAPLCGKSLPGPVRSTGNYLMLRLVTRGTQPRVDFVGEFTSVKPDQESLLQTRESGITSSPSNHPPSFIPSANQSCGSPHVILKTDTVRDSQSDAVQLILYITVGLLAAMLLLCWCCWSPGWFLWRLSVCRFLACCNATCASCQLCSHSCSRKELRLSKVMPQGTATSTT